MSDAREDTELRQRKPKKRVTINEEVSYSKDKPSRHGSEEEEDVSLVGTYWLTRVIFLRALALIYFVAFAVAYNQNKELIGDRGLLPAKLHLSRIKQRFAKDQWQRFISAPSFLWFWDPWDSIDDVLDGIAASGMALSAAVIATGAANSAAMLVLWLLYHSLVNVGQTWYSFGWESQLLETGFLAIWIVPFTNWTKYPEGTPSPWTAVVGYRYVQVVRHVLHT